MEACRLASTRYAARGVFIRVTRYVRRVFFAAMCAVPSKPCRFDFAETPRERGATIYSGAAIYAIFLYMVFAPLLTPKMLTFYAAATLIRYASAMSLRDEISIRHDFNRRAMRFCAVSAPP